MKPIVLLACFATVGCAPTPCLPEGEVGVVQRVIEVDDYTKAVAVTVRRRGGNSVVCTGSKEFINLAPGDKIDGKGLTKSL